MNQTCLDLSLLPSPPWGDTRDLRKEKADTLDDKNNLLDRISSSSEILFNRFEHQLTVFEWKKWSTMRAGYGLHHRVKLLICIGNNGLIFVLKKKSVDSFWQFKNCTEYIRLKIFLVVVSSTLTSKILTYFDIYKCHWSNNLQSASFVA